MKAIILAGGFGTRLRERVPDLPKPMVPIAGRPFLEYVLDRLILGGVREIVLSVGYRAESIQAHFGAGYRKAALRYSIEAEALGTGGAIALALRKEGNHPILVLNGDTFLNLEFNALIHWYEQDPADVAIVLREIADATRYGAVITTGEQVIGFSEKGKSGPGLINAGVYILRPEALSRFGQSEKFSFESDFLQRHCGVLKPKAFKTNAYFIDIGMPEDFDLAQHELSLIAGKSPANETPIP